MLFSELRLSAPILRALDQEGYTTPTPIQAQAIPHILDGRDLLGCAQTGTGKTAAFALPVIHRLSEAPVDKSHRGVRKARCLVLSPTRELAAQIGESFAVYGGETLLEHTVIYGGVSQMHQERALRRGVDIIVATPGRLMDLMEQRLVDLTGIEVFILDEADRMLDMGFIQPIRRIAAAIPASQNRQTLLFSATMPGPIQQLANSLLRDPVRVSVNPVSSAAPKIEQGLYFVSKNDKPALLEHFLCDPEASITRALVFTKTKHGAERLGKRLMRAGIAAETIHGNKNQNQRTRALARFSSGQARVLVATDVAARGLDVDDITHVFNFDLPMEPEAYVHRIGRTARAGAKGVAISFCDSEERGLLRDIERLGGKKLPVLRPIEVLLTSSAAPLEKPVAEVQAKHPPRRKGGAGHQGHGHHHAAGHGSGHGGGQKPSGPRRRPAAAAGASSGNRSSGDSAQRSGSAPASAAKSSTRGWNRPTRRRSAR